MVVKLTNILVDLIYLESVMLNKKIIMKHTKKGFILSIFLFNAS